MKKGFTLIELLAVIVILAIIALIATPIVLNIINDAKDSAIERSIENILGSARAFYVNESLKSEDYSNRSIYEKIKDNLQGNKPDSGVVYVNSEGNVAMALIYGDTCYLKNYSDSNINKTDSSSCKLDFEYLAQREASISENSNFLNGPLKRKSIERLYTVKSKEVPEDALGSFDVSEKQNGSIMAWYFPTGNTDLDGNPLYELYIGQDGGVKANEKCNSIFAALSNAVFINLSNLDTSNVKNMATMFGNNYKLETLNLSGWDTSNVESMRGMFQSCLSLETLDLSSFDTSKVTNMRLMFGANEDTKLKEIKGIENFTTSNVANMVGMFQHCANLKSLNLSNWDVSNVREITHIFKNCSGLQTLNLNGWKIQEITSMESMFESCNSLKSLNLSNWDVSNVANMNYLFNNCDSLHTLSLDGWDTSSVTSMISMFKATKELEDISVLSGFNVSRVENFEYFLSNSGVTSLVPLASWNTKSATTMGSMFRSCKNLQTLNGLQNWDVSKVLNFSEGVDKDNSHSEGAFEGLTSLTDASAINSWNLNENAVLDKMFKNTSVHPSFVDKNGNQINGTWAEDGSFVRN